MAWYEFIWLDDFTEGNIEHLAQHGFTPEDFEFVFATYEGEEISDSTGNPMRFGHTEDGRSAAIVFEWIEKDITVLPVTMFPVPERKS